MTVIRIRGKEKGPENSEFEATVSFDADEEYELTLTNPLGPKRQEELEWYFEQWLKFPFTDKVRAQTAAASLKDCGESLFDQIFYSDRNAYARYRQIKRDDLRIEIAGSPLFHQIHWEALKDPELPQPLCLEVPLVRKNLTPRPMTAETKASPTINLLIVTARPGELNDVGYRTISRPLVEQLGQAGIPVRIDIVRPGTYEAFSNHLEDVKDEYGLGYYHIIHFDMHGGLLDYARFQEASTEKAQDETQLSRDRLSPIQPYQDLKAFLCFESDSEKIKVPVEAGELADLLLAHHVQMIVLNACQSAKQKGETETSLASRLMLAGVQTVVAMAYSVTVSAAERLMKTVYQQLFEHASLPIAIRRGRLELYNRKERRARFDQTVELEDWVLPVVYEHETQSLLLRPMTPAETNDWYEQKVIKYQPPVTDYGFVGRDLDVLRIEKRLLKHNCLLVRGMGGAGKTTLLKHLGNWWQTTQFVKQVFEFGFDTQAWTCEGIIDSIARQLLTEVEYLQTFQPMRAPAQAELITDCLASRRHLLILDNLESITGSELVIGHALPENERARLHNWLKGLTGGKTFVVLGSRGQETWLSNGTFDKQVYEIPGLDPQATSDLAYRILERYNVTQYRDDSDFQRLMTLLAGYPLALEVVLANLAVKTPSDVVAGLHAGDIDLDTTDSSDKTKNLVSCIDYSYSNLSPEAQRVLLCLAPFTGVVQIKKLPDYFEKLTAQPALANLIFDDWETVLQEALNWGLVTPDNSWPDWLRLQPIFPYFLRTRLAAQREVKQAVETGFRHYYDEMADSLHKLMYSKEPKERHLGQALTGLEFENLLEALRLTLEAQESILKIFLAVLEYLDLRHDMRYGLELSKVVLAKLYQDSPKVLEGEMGLELAMLISQIASPSKRG